LSVYVFDHVFGSDVAQYMCGAGSEDWMHNRCWGILECGG
jgi:hypothetical protein